MARAVLDTLDETTAPGTMRIEYIEVMMSIVQGVLSVVAEERA